MVALPILVPGCRSSPRGATRTCSELQEWALARRERVGERLTSRQRVHGGNAELVWRHAKRGRPWNEDESLTSMGSSKAVMTATNALLKLPPLDLTEELRLAAPIGRHRRRVRRDIPVSTGDHQCVPHADLFRWKRRNVTASWPETGTRRSVGKTDTAGLDKLPRISRKRLSRC